MGASRGKSSGLDWQDVNQALVNLRAVLGGTILLEMQPQDRGGSWDLVIRAIRLRPQLGALDQPVSVCVSVSCRAARFVELEAACMSALSQLDVACYAQNAYMPNQISA